MEANDIRRLLDITEELQACQKKTCRAQKKASDALLLHTQSEIFELLMKKEPGEITREERKRRVNALSKKANTAREENELMLCSVRNCKAKFDATLHLMKKMLDHECKTAKKACDVIKKVDKILIGKLSEDDKISAMRQMKAFSSNPNNW